MFCLYIFVIFSYTINKQQFLQVGPSLSHSYTFIEYARCQ
jgi:hypothetical protein